MTGKYRNFILPLSSVIAVTFVLLTGCGTTLTGYDFSTNAIYSATKSGLKVEIDATGKVKAGEDLGDGEATGIISGNNIQGSISFKLVSSQTIEFTMGQDKTTIQLQKGLSEALLDYFNRIGYTSFDKSEIDELGKVIQAVIYGPKGTFLEGQTKLINVVDVKFNR